MLERILAAATAAADASRERAALLQGLLTKAEARADAQKRRADQLEARVEEERGGNDKSIVLQLE